MIPIKTQDELAGMRRSGQTLKKIVSLLQSKIQAGMLTIEIDKIAEGLFSSYNVHSAFKGYRGFPANICVSLNSEVVHGIPSGERRLKQGDLLKIDIGIREEEFYADCAFSMILGRADAKTKKLVETTKKALDEAIAQAKVDNYLSDISWAVQSLIEAQGFSVVRDFVGHGIGRLMHEEPEVPNFGLPHRGPAIRDGMVLAIEPMVNMGTWEVKLADNGWTALTKDGLNSAHFEHTVAITKGGPEVLTA